MTWHYLQTIKDETGVRSLFKDESGDRHLDFTSYDEGNLRIQVVTRSTATRKEFIKEMVSEIGAEEPLARHLDEVMRATRRVKLPMLSNRA